MVMKFTSSSLIFSGSFFLIVRGLFAHRRRAAFSDSERIKSFCMPTRKHFANRQQLHRRRNVCVIGQSPSFGHLKS